MVTVARSAFICGQAQLQTLLASVLPLWEASVPYFTATSKHSGGHRKAPGDTALTVFLV